MNGVPLAEELVEVLPGVFRWSVYSPVHKVELTSHARLRGDSLLVFDPISLRPNLREYLTGKVRHVRVFLTSENHERDADEWRVPGGSVSARCSAGFDRARVDPLAEEVREWHGLEVIPLAGGPAGESVIYERGCRLAFVGDAIVNLPARGLELLPAKYCHDQSVLQQSIQQLVEAEIDHLFPAHGKPVGPEASSRLAELLRTGPSVD